MSSLAPLFRDLVPAQRLCGVVGEFVHEDLLGPTVMAPARGAAGLAREAARQPQRTPVRRAVAGAREPRDVDERLREEGRVAVHGLDVGGQPAQAQAQHAGRQVRHPSVGEDDEAGVVADQVQAPELLLPRPPDPDAMSQVGICAWG